MVAGEIPGTTPENCQLTLTDLKVLTIKARGELITPSKCVADVKLEAKAIVTIDDNDQNKFTF